MQTLLPQPDAALQPLRPGAPALPVPANPSRANPSASPAPQEAPAGELLREGYDALLSGHGDLARGRFLEAEAVLPDSPVPGVLLATLDLLIGEPAASHERLVALRKRHPECPLVRAHLVEVLIAQGRSASARAELQRLRRLDMPPELENLANALEQALSLPTKPPEPEPT